MQVEANAANFEQMISGGGPVLVKFYNSSCPHCKHVDRLLQQLEQQTGGRVKIVKTKDPSILQHFNVTTVPTVTFINDNQHVQTWRGNPGNVQQYLNVIQDYV